MTFDKNGIGYTVDDFPGIVYEVPPGGGATSRFIDGFPVGGDRDPNGLCVAPATFSGKKVSPGDLIVIDHDNNIPNGYIFAAPHRGWITVHGYWKVANGKLVQLSDYWSKGPKGGTYAYTGSYDWTDYSVSADIMSTDDDRIGFVFRYLGANNYYIYSWSKQWHPTRIIAKVVNGKGTVIAEKDDAGFEVGKWYNTKVEVNGNKITVYQDGAEVLNATDDSLSYGKAGLLCHANTGSYFDNFKVTPIGVSPPTTPTLPFSDNFDAESLDLLSKRVKVLVGPEELPGEPEDAVFGPDGSLYVVSGWKGKGISLFTVSADGDISILTDFEDREIYCLRAIAVSPASGDIFVLADKGRIFRVDPVTEEVTLFGDKFGPFRAWSHLTFSPDGSALFVGVCGDKDAIYAITGFGQEVKLTGDVNGDGKVDAADLAAVAAAFNSIPGNPNWNPDADLNQDDIVDILDLALVGKKFGT